MQPGDFGNEVIPVVVSAEEVLLGRSPTVVAGQIQDVDLLELGRQVAEHEGVQLADGQTVLELVAVVGPLASLVDFAAGEVAVGEHPEHGEGELGRERVFGPLDHGVHVAFGAVQETGKL